MSKQNITFAIFDVRPVDPQSGRVNFELIDNLQPVINLSPGNKEKKIILPAEKPGLTILSVKSASPAIRAKEGVLEELQATLSEKFDFRKELELFGGKLIDSAVRPRSRYSPSLVLKKKEEDFSFSYLEQDNQNLDKFRDEFLKLFSGATSKSKQSETETPLSGESPLSGEAKSLTPPPYLPWAPEVKIPEENNQSILDLSPAARELDVVLTAFQDNKIEDYKLETSLEPPALVLPAKTYQEQTSRPLIYFSAVLTGLFLLSFLVVGSFNLKNNILQRSNQAYINLGLVQNNLSEFKFFEAASSFSLAARNFELMYQDLKKAGAIFNILDTVTLGGVSQAADLIEAGELISQAGLDLASALEKISGINLISIIQPDGKNYVRADILEILRGFRINLIQASRNLNKAGSLISGSDTGLIPESERTKFEELKTRLPDFSSFIEKAVNYTDALMTMLGQSNPQRYLLLFQNTSEIRPTGGFPGSYALVEFDKGIMKKFQVDDIYNPDGQMKENIIPPRPLQKITPNWGMRDANWFIDFRSSARKVAEFYYKDSGILVDGVVAANVDLIPEILKITGPIEMPDFGLTLNPDNFIVEVQKEVEYERTKGENQPKQILVDFAPKLIERLAGLSQENWMKVFTVLVSGIEGKDILAYFADNRLENFILENGLAGEINQTYRDYLMVTHSNIMGSKTDLVIDNFVSLKIDNSEGGLIHNLEVTRKHNGGNLGFYNKKNNDYLRILVPEEAEFIDISGNDKFEVIPLLDYRQNGFVADPDLEIYESRIRKEKGVEIFEESNKKIIAFWMIVEPGQSKTIKIQYRTPSHHGIYIQKQPGLKSELKLIFNEKTLFDEKLSSDKNITLE